MRELTRALVEQEIASLEAQREELWARLNQVMGALQAYEALLPLIPQDADNGEESPEEEKDK